MLHKSSFRSSHYPKTAKRFVLIQQYAQPYYNVFALFILVTAVVMVLNHHNPFQFAVITSGIGILIANFMGAMRLKSQIAEIYFVNEQFYVLFIDDILKGGEIHSFPLRFAYFGFTKDGATIHYHDRILNLYEKDWEEWSLLTQHFLSPPPQELTINYEYVEKSADTSTPSNHP